MPVSKHLARVFVIAAAIALHASGVFAQEVCDSVVHYGNNPEAGKYGDVNGIRLYYETYGDGPPLLIIHGNGGTINAMQCQIAFFARNHHVIAADSRGHGKSGLGDGGLTQAMIADDLATLLSSLGIQQADVLGHSDGGIVALLFAIRHPGQAGKVVASAANLRPDASGQYQWFIDRIEVQLKEAERMIAAKDTSRDWNRRRLQIEMMLKEPHITGSDLSKISAPVLVVGSDADLVPLEHFVEIYEGIRNAQLFIMPGATHGMNRREAELFNSVASRFLDRPFSRPTTREPTPRTAP